MDEHTIEIAPATVIDLENDVIGLHSNGTAGLMPRCQGGLPARLDGHTIGFGMLTPETMPPHAGELHTDGDEVLFMVSGQIDVHLELATGEQIVRVGPGQAVVVPSGVWHVIHLIEPGQLLNITPGPDFDYRPLPTVGR